MPVTQEPLFIQYSMPLMTYLHIRTKIILGLQNYDSNYIRITKCDRDGLQCAIGLEITKYDRAGLQIAIGFGLQSATEI